MENALLGALHEPLDPNPLFRECFGIASVPEQDRT